MTFGTEPARVDDRLIATVRARMQPLPQPLFAPGERVMIGEGPFAGIDAVYEIADGERRAMVLINILGKAARLAVPVSGLTKPR